LFLLLLSADDDDDPVEQYQSREGRKDDGKQKEKKGTKVTSLCVQQVFVSLRTSLQTDKNRLTDSTQPAILVIRSSFSRL